MNGKTDTSTKTGLPGDVGGDVGGGMGGLGAPASAVAGIHHVTAMASDPQRNLEFYTKVLGLRLVKWTVNYDDPATYHLYFGDEAGSPGSILTFFPWPRSRRGVTGAGSQTAVAFTTPTGTLGAWRGRLSGLGVRGFERFGRPGLAVADPDGLAIEIVEAEALAGEPRLVGFDHATLTARDPASLRLVLAGVLGMREVGAEGGRLRFEAAAAGHAASGAKGSGGMPRVGDLGRYVDVVVEPDASRSKLGAGIVHHLAMRARDDAEQAGWMERVFAAGLQTTPVVDRSYFRSIYFREPGGVLFEIATDAPGFAIDESPESLGTRLVLPAHLEPRRAELLRVLPPMTLRA